MEKNVDRGSDLFLDSDELKFLHDVSSTLTSSLNLQETVSSIFEILNIRFGCVKAALVLGDSVLNSVSVKVAFGINSEELESRFHKEWFAASLKVIESRKPIVLKQVKYVSGARDSFIELSFISIPLVLAEDVYGTINVFFPSKKLSCLNNFVKLLGVISLMISQEIKLKKLLNKEKDVLKEENVILKQELSEKYNIHNMLGKSRAMCHVFKLINQVSLTNANVLICGESGTGKELVAQAVHYQSRRSEGPFIRINCGAIPETLIESELFGHQKGSFTDAFETKIGKFEAAHGGTIFLDEVAELTPQLQVKLLRVLQEREITRLGGVKPISVDVRLIAATNKDLHKLIKTGQIREDFYYRLNVFSIILPPLRERQTDICLLAEYFLDKYRIENQKNISKISSAALTLLCNHSWPGNVRELENSIERAVIMCNGDCLDVTHFPISSDSEELVFNKFDIKDVSLKDKVDEFEKTIILEALKYTKGNVSVASRNLKTTHRILGYKISNYGIDLKKIKR